MLKMNKRGRRVFFTCIAILMLSEMIAANIYSLFWRLEETAELIGVDVEVERARLMLLIVLDFIPGVGAILAARAYKYTDAAHLGGIGVFMASGGILSYGLYQLWFATYLLQWMPAFHQGVGAFYVSLGILAWFLGSDLRRQKLTPNKPM